MELKVINIQKWLKENEDKFLPPVCNYIMHDNQLVVMFVGGPNSREDYHIEEGEEFFYMIKGDMVLKIVEKGIKKDIIIKENECFLLPPRIPHSPQRYKDTVGLVIERKRLDHEMDILRYYIKDSNEPLYEKAFYCKSLMNLKPIIDGFFASVEKKTGKPTKENRIEKLPFKIDTETKVNAPFNLSDKLLQSVEDRHLFDGNFQFKIEIFYDGLSTEPATKGETWIWQKAGSSVIKIDEKVFNLVSDDCILIPQDVSYSMERSNKATVIKFQQYV